MKIKNEEFEVLIPNIDGSGVAEKVIVTIPLEWDEELNQWLLTPEAHEIIDNTKARRMGLLLPHELKELRVRYGYSQMQMGELFQVGEKSWNRWETGKQRPSRSINLLIRALYEGEISINYLLKRAGKAARAEISATKHYSQLLSYCLAHGSTAAMTGSFDDSVKVVEIKSGFAGKSHFMKNFGKILQYTATPAEKTLMASTQWRQRGGNTTFLAKADTKVNLSKVA